MTREPNESDVVFNVVFTPGTFRFLELFTRSLIAESAVRFRLVANGCGADEVRAMQAFASASDGRVDVTQLSGSAMVRHGAALEAIYTAHDDGSYFCFVDSDILAKRPFMGAFLELLADSHAVTSGNVAWSDDTVLPEGARDLVGRHAVGHDGFVYGTSYLAIYRRDAVAQVRDRWSVSFGAAAHDQLPAPVRARLAEMGRTFGLYDTAKVLNLLLQGDGYVVAHVGNAALVHVGGISQYLSDPSVLGSPPATSTAEEGNVPWFATSGAGRDRWDFARWAAAMLRSIVDNGPAPELPDDAGQRKRAITMQREFLALAGR